MIRFFCIAAAGLSLTSCLNKDTNVCSVTQVEPAITAVGPKTVAVNQTATYTVSYAPLSNCGTFQSFLEQSGAVTNSVIVGVRVYYSSCDCPSSSTISQTTYSLKPTQAGTYYLNFVSSNGYITDTLVVK